MHPRLLLVAVQLLTRLPVGDPARDDGDGGRAVAWFGVVGAMIGGVAGFVYWAAAIALPPVAAATLATAVTALVAGNVHVAGLGVVAGALLEGGGPDRRIEVMATRTPTSNGVTAQVVVILLRVSLLAALGPEGGAAALIVVASLGRGLGALALLGVAPVGADPRWTGLLDAVAPWAAGVAALTATLITALLVGTATPALLLAVTASALLLRGLAVARLGGLDRNVVGAMTTVGEVVALSVLVGVDAVLTR